MALKYLNAEELEKWKAQNPGKTYFDTAGNPVSVPSTTKDLGFLGNLARTVSKPFRVGGGALQELGYTVGDIVRLAQGKNPLERPEQYVGLTQEESRALYEDPLREGLKSAAGVMSYAVPAGAAEGATTAGARIGTAAARGAGAGTLGSFALSESGKELETALKGAGLGFLMGGALQGVGEGVKAIKSAKVSNKLDDLADDLQASALKKDIGIAPTTKQGKNILPKEVLETANKMGVKIKNPEDLKTFGQALYESNANVANVAAQQLDDLGRAIDITDIKKPLLEQLAKTKSPELRAPIQKVIDSIDNATGGSNVISASELLNLKREWGKLGNWNPLMDPAATTTAGAFESAYIKANDLLDDAFKSAGITGFKEANKALSLAIDADNWADRAIANRASRPLWNDMTQDAAIAATVFGGGGPAAIAGAVGSKALQRYAEPLAEGALRGASKVVGGASALPQVLQPILNVGQRAVPAVAGLRADTQEVGTQGVGTQPIYPTGTIPTTQGGQQGVGAQGISPLNLMLAQEVLNGNISAAEANAVLSLLGMEQDKTPQASAAQMDAQNAINMVNRLSQSIASTGLTGPIKGLGAKIPYATEFKDLQAQIDLARQVVGKFLEGGVLRKEDEEKYKKILPTMYDTPEVAQRKLQNIMTELQSRLAQYEATGYSGYGQDPYAAIDELGL